MEKLEKLRKALQKQNLDALLITNDYNRRYMTGFTGTTGVAIVSLNDAVFITDFRYTEQASEQVKGYRIVENKGTIMQEIANQVQLMGIKTLGFEKNNVTFEMYEIYSKLISADLVGVSGIVENIRLIKSPEEIKIIKVACEIVDATFEHIIQFIKPGRTELEVSNEMEFFMRKLGATSSSFDTIVASGLRSALPHGVATDKIIEKGDLVTLDFGALYNGYISDTTRTVAVGEPADQLKEIYQIVLEAQLLGLEQFKPGMTGIEFPKR